MLFCGYDILKDEVIGLAFVWVDCKALPDGQRTRVGEVKLYWDEQMLPCLGGLLVSSVGEGPSPDGGLRSTV